MLPARYHHDVQHGKDGAVGWPTDLMSVSIVIVTFNSAHRIGECLRAISKTLPGAETIVVDNGSSDATVAIAHREGAQTVVEGHGNIGFGPACNLGAAARSKALVLFLNPDVLMTRADDVQL